MSKNDWQHRGRVRRSLFWPLTLILLGLVFLAYNLGLLNQDVWSTLIDLWPLLLVLIGLDGILNRSGIVGPSLMISLGLIFLLSNFGYILVDVWQMILSLWPVLLIAIGFDILIGRRSWLLSLLGVGVVLIIVIASIRLMTGASYAAGGQEFSYPAAGVEQAEMNFDIPVGTSRFSALPDSTDLLVGQVPEGGGIAIQDQFVVQSGQASFNLSATGSFVSVPGISSPYVWEFQIAQQIPLTLRVSQGVGSANLDLAALELEGLELSMGAGQITASLPDGQSFSGRLSAGLGQLLVIVPAGAGVRIQSGAALAAFTAPPGYQQSGNVYTSPSYSTADERIDLELSVAIGSVVVQER
jgi:hypothetical protein